MLDLRVNVIVNKVPIANPFIRAWLLCINFPEFLSRISRKNEANRTANKSKASLTSKTPTSRLMIRLRRYVDSEISGLRKKSTQRRQMPGS